MSGRTMSTMVRRAAVALVAVAVAVPLIAARADAFIYWSKNPGNGGGLIGRANNDGGGANYTFMSGLFGARALAIDGSYVYWANGSNSIGRANLDGTGANSNFVSGIFTANALVVDSANGYIFWADANGSRIGRANLANGLNVNTSLISTFGAKATGVAVDTASKVVYWTTNQAAGQGVIGRANEDGSNAQPTWIHSLFGAQGLTLDGSYLYWANGPDQIGQVKLDGTGPNPTYIVGPRIGTPSGSNADTPVPMAAHDGFLYWGNLFDGYIGRVPNVAGATNPNNKFIGILGSATGLAINTLATPGPLPPPPAPDIDLFKRDVQRVELPRGIERSLLAKLDAVQQALDDGDQAAACDVLTAFVSQTDALTGKKIAVAPAVGLVADAMVIQQTLGCDAG
ncbi:MAG: hypothetical protein ABWZ91_16660 [Nocardioides sp.]